MTAAARAILEDTARIFGPSQEQTGRKPTADASAERKGQPKHKKARLLNEDETAQKAARLDQEEVLLVQHELQCK